LGRRYPKARQALIEVRDRGIGEFMQGRGTAALFEEVRAIDQYLAVSSVTSQLFRFLHEKQPELAQQCYPLAESALVENGEAQLAQRYLGDGQARFRAVRSQWESLGANERRVAQINSNAQAKAGEYWALQGQPPPHLIVRPSVPKMADQFLALKTLQIMEILGATGQVTAAERIRSQALPLIEDPWSKLIIGAAPMSGGT
jgi:hypothetical protein